MKKSPSKPQRPGAKPKTTSAKKPGFKKSSSRDGEDEPKKKSHPGAWVKRPAKGQFEVDPKDANTVNSIRAKLQEIREYKKILAQDGQLPDADDKERESNLIKQLIRIEKGLPPIKPAKKKKKKKKVVLEKQGKGKMPVPKGS